MRLAVLTGLYVGVVCSAQIGAQKIIELPFTGDAAPGGAYLIGVALALIELANRTASTRREGWVNAQIMVACGFAASVLNDWIPNWAEAIAGSAASIPTASAVIVNSLFMVILSLIGSVPCPLSRPLIARSSGRGRLSVPRRGTRP